MMKLILSILVTLIDMSTIRFDIELVIGFRVPERNAALIVPFSKEEALNKMKKLEERLENTEAALQRSEKIKRTLLLARQR